MIEIGPDEVGQRVDVVVAARFEVTRTQAQRAVKDGVVMVSGDPVKPSYRLEAGDTIDGVIAPTEYPPPGPEQIPVDIRYQDDDILVVSKPAGLVTHPARGHDSGTLVNALLGLGLSLSGEGSIRPGIVHRLDKDTSGLLVVARHDAAAAALVASMQSREVERRYLALVRGAPATASGTIEAPVGRHPAKRRQMAVIADGKPSITHYRVVEKTDELTLLEVSLETGRTHQIRVHLAHLGMPVLGDKTYGGRSELSQRMELERSFLHAFRLKFPHPVTREIVEVTDRLPSDLAQVLARAGLDDPT